MAYPIGVLFEMSKTILVTGGAGYIGAHACQRLAQARYRPVVLDNFSNGHRAFVKWGPLEALDLTDPVALDAAFERHHPVAILHFAGSALVGESALNPGKYYRNNVGCAVNLLEAMVKHGVREIVFSSTCATYGMPVRLPLDEEHPQNPINTYGRSKLMVEQILRDYESAHGIRHAILRYFNAAGADPKGEIGEDHNPETHLIPVALDVAMGRRESLSIFGSDYDTPDGSCVRDYIHVADLAEAHLRALEVLDRDGKSLEVNLGVGRGYSVREVVDSVERITGRKIKIINEPRRAGDPPTLVSDPRKAEQLLGFRPAFIELDKIIADAWRWHEKRFSGSRVTA